MNYETTPRIVNMMMGGLLAGLCALLTACAAVPPTPTPVSATPTPTPVARRVSPEMQRAALLAMNFEARDDGYHLSLPALLTFSFDSNILAASARATLLRVGYELTELGIERALVRGHTDNVGTTEYNLSLSKRRADVVARVLSEGGYPAVKIDSNGVGSAVPTADNNTPEGRSQNRRVVIIVQII